MIQELVTGFIGILTFAAGCIELVLAQALLRQRLRLLQICGAGIAIGQLLNHDVYTGIGSYIEKENLLQLRKKINKC